MPLLRRGRRARHGAGPPLGQPTRERTLSGGRELSPEGRRRRGGRGRGGQGRGGGGGGGGRGGGGGGGGGGAGGGGGGGGGGARVGSSMGMNHLRGREGGRTRRPAPEGPPGRG